MLIKHGGNFNYLLIFHWSAVSGADEVNPMDKYPSKTGAWDKKDKAFFPTPKISLYLS